jgi:broad specificity phosphatase PhoE
VFSSPSCRAWQTALHAFGTEYKIVNSLLTRTTIIPEQRTDIAKQLRSLLMSVEIVPGSNVVLTGHGAPFKGAGKAALDEDNTRKQRTRLETGFIVLEKKGWPHNCPVQIHQREAICQRADQASGQMSSIECTAL